MPTDEQQQYFATQGNVARPVPGDSVPLAVVETIARMLGEHWAAFGKQWDAFGQTLKEIRIEIADLNRARHEAPCRDMREHMAWHTEQARENRTFRRAIIIMLGSSMLAAAMACLGRLII